MLVRRVTLQSHAPKDFVGREQILRVTRNKSAFEPRDICDFLLQPCHCILKCRQSFISLPFCRRAALVGLTDEVGDQMRREVFPQQ